MWIINIFTLTSLVLRARSRKKNKVEMRNIAIISCLEHISVPGMHKTKLIEVAKIMGWKRRAIRMLIKVQLMSTRLLFRSQLILCTFKRGRLSWTWTSVLDKYFYYVIRAMKKSKTSPKKYANQTGKMQSRKMIKCDSCFPLSMITKQTSTK